MEREGFEFERERERERERFEFERERERLEFVTEEVPYSHNPTPAIPNPKLQTANQMATKRGRYRCTLRPSTT
jgi:hypothetical protein